MQIRFNHYRLLTVLLLLIYSATTTYAQDLDQSFTAHWVSKLNPNTRLCDMSIPEAHDAATHFTDWAAWQDQQYDEKELFRRGVRAFDMRLYYGFNFWKGVASLWNTYFSHGGDLGRRFGGMSFNTICSEIHYHFPTPGDLEGEFMILFFQWEGDGDRSDEDKLKAFNDFIRYLEEKYGSDRFIPFRKDLTIADVKGKIILITSEGVYKTENISSDYVKIPISYQETYGQNICTNGKLTAQDWDGKEMEGKTARFFQQNEWDKKIPEKKNSIKTGFVNWFNYLKDPDSKYNEACAFNKAQINSYSWPDNGGDICADDPDRDDENARIGCNHYTSDLLKEYRMPYGFVRFDFVGTTKEDGCITYGNELLHTVIRNNFHLSDYYNDGRYIKDIMISRNNSQEAAKLLLTNNGYSINNECHTNSGADNVNSYQFIGYKTTNDANEAITDLIVYTGGLNPKEEIPWDGRTYHLVGYIEDENQKKDGYKGCLNASSDTELLYLYFTKDPCRQVLSDIAVLTEATTEITPDETKQVHLIQEQALWGPLLYDLVDKGRIDLNNNMKSTSTKENTVRIQCDRHIHSENVEDHYITTSADYHYVMCNECNSILTIEAHNRDKLNQEEGYVHSYECTVCGYKDYEECNFQEDENLDTLYYNNGFGKCDICNNKSVNSAIWDKNLQRYFIHNLGSLYWFAGKVNHGGGSADAQILIPFQNFDIASQVPSSFKWEPIGIHGYHHTFDGNGCTINGLVCERSEDDAAVGIFATVQGGTVRNLGITDSYFKGNRYVGGIAGELIHGNLENVYSNANYGDTNGNGTVVGQIYNSTINTGYNFNYWSDKRAIGHFLAEDTQTQIKHFYTVSGFELSVLDDYLNKITYKEVENGKLCELLNAGAVCLPGEVVDGGAIRITAKFWKQDLGSQEYPVFTDQDNAGVTTDISTYTAGTPQSFKQGLYLDNNRILILKNGMTYNLYGQKVSIQN